MRVVFDTGILISACLYPDRQPALVYLAALQRHELVASLATREELRTVLARPRFDAWRAAAERRAWFEQHNKCTQLVAITTRVTDCADPKDNIFLELALSAAAQAIVSSDPHLLCMHPYRDIAILGLQDFRETFLA